ncbi:carbohydrate porin [Stenotrophomonas sp. MYb238]|uniref:porin n=1 Tax=Stenotrophomonas sp. MYb238 TaxID=2040281 RepID=UPI0012919D2D|nr:porin [Stenotrophomonas sp. MYb238]MQP77693.1 carbohydrate porin [Stenotrophomonas sp. MYb238]
MRSHSLALAVAASLGLASAPAFAAGPAVTPAQIEQLQAQIAALQAQVQQLQTQSESLQAQSDAQSEVNVTQAQALESAQKTQTSVDKLAKLVNDNKIGGRMFFDVSSIDQKTNGRKTDATGTGFDVKRFYLTVDHKFNDIWSANLTTDFQYSSAIGNTELFVKNAYVQGTFDPAFVLKIGAAGMPWTGYVEKYYGMRYVENTLTDRLKYANSADWGMHASGDLGQGLNYAVSVVNGAGYKNPSRSKGVDVEGRLAWEITPEFAVALGGYSGYLGQDKQTNSAEKRYSRGDVMVAYASPVFRLGGEYFTAKNLSQVQQTIASPVSDKATGWSLWSSVRLAQTANGDVSVFGRYDNTDTSKTLNPFREDTYWNVGVEYPVLKNFKLAAVYKDTDATVGSLASPSQTKTKELGIWGDLKF